MALVKPGLVTGTIVTGGEIGQASGDEFQIKVMDIDYDFYTRVEEVTGDSDPHPAYEHNELLDARVAIRGAMVATLAAGIAELVGSNNPVTIHTFDLGGGSPETIKMILIIERMRLKWGRTRAYVGVSLLCRMTGMTADQVANIEV